MTIEQTLLVPNWNDLIWFETVWKDSFKTLLCSKNKMIFTYFKLCLLKRKGLLLRYDFHILNERL